MLREAHSCKVLHFRTLLKSLIRLQTKCFVFDLDNLLIDAHLFVVFFLNHLAAAAIFKWVDFKIQIVIDVNLMIILFEFL